VRWERLANTRSLVTPAPKSENLAPPVPGHPRLYRDVPALREERKKAPASLVKFLAVWRAVGAGCPRRCAVPFSRFGSGLEAGVSAGATGRALAGPGLMGWLAQRSATWFPALHIADARLRRHPVPCWQWGADSVTREPAGRFASRMLSSRSVTWPCCLVRAEPGQSPLIRPASARAWCSPCSGARVAISPPRDTHPPPPPPQRYHPRNQPAPPTPPPTPPPPPSPTPPPPRTSSDGFSVQGCQRRVCERPLTDVQAGWASDPGRKPAPTRCFSSGPRRHPSGGFDLHTRAPIWADAPSLACANARAGLGRVPKQTLCGHGRAAGAAEP